MSDTCNCEHATVTLYIAQDALKKVNTKPT